MFEYIDDIFEKINVCNIADACDRKAIPCRWLSKQFHVMHSRKFWGLADTLMWGPTRKHANIRQASPATWQQVKDFVSGFEHHDYPQVYVAGCLHPATDYVLAGGLSINYMALHGYQGALFNGAIRDHEDLGHL